MVTCDIKMKVERLQFQFVTFDEDTFEKFLN